MTGTVNGETLISEQDATSDGVWLVETDAYIVAITLAPDSITFAQREAWNTYLDEFRDFANTWASTTMRTSWPVTILASVANQSNEPISIVWEESAFVGADGETSRVIKSGVRFSEMQSAVTPTLIPPGGRVDETIAPVNKVSYSSVHSRWQQEPILHAQDSGRAFSLFLTFEHADTKSRLNLAFDAVREIQFIRD